jgi:hypothetical protein
MDADLEQKLSVLFTLHCELKTKTFWSVGSIVLILVQAIRPLAQWCGFGPVEDATTGHGRQPLPRRVLKKNEKKPLPRHCSPPSCRCRRLLVTLSPPPISPTGSLSHFLFCHVEPYLKQMREGRTGRSRRRTAVADAWAIHRGRRSTQVWAGNDAHALQDSGIAGIVCGQTWGILPLPSSDLCISLFLSCRQTMHSTCLANCWHCQCLNHNWRMFLGSDFQSTGNTVIY